MTLVYNLPSTQAIYQRFAGIDGSAYIVGGFWHDGADRQQHRAGADPLRHRAAVGAPTSATSNTRRGATWNPF